MPEVAWLTCFLDHGPGVHEPATAFWAAATGCTPSPPRGEHDEFATLLPAQGDPHVRVQRLDTGASGVHLDLHAADHEALAARAVGLGATEVGRLDDVVVLRSPGGFGHCAVPAEESVLAPATDWGGHSSRTDQLCLDVPTAGLAAESAYWSALLAQPLVPSARYTEFTDVRRAPHLPLRLMLQEVGHAGPVTAHVDLATTDRAAEVERLVSLGALLEGVHRHWTVLLDPAGRRFCVTDQEPLRP